MSQQPFQYQEYAAPPLTDHVSAVTASGVQGQVLAGRQVQYQAIAAPFAAALPVVVTLTYWTPTYPDRLRPMPPVRSATTHVFSPQPEITLPRAWHATYPAAIARRQVHPSSLPAASQQVTTTFPAAAGQGQQGQVLAGRQVQYQAIASPFTATIPSGALTYWTPTYPDRLPGRLGLPRIELVAPQPELTIARAWNPQYPDTIDRRTTHAARQLAFTIAPQPEVTSPQAWSAIYPDAIARKIVAAASQQAWVSSPQPEVINPKAWGAFYPSRLVRVSVRAADQPCFATGSTASSFPIPEHSWRGSYPDRIDPKAGQRPDLQRLLALDPFPITATVDQYGWRPIYPDRPRRLDLLAADQQALAFSPQPEVTSPLVWSAIFPDHLDRRLYPTGQPLAFVTSPQPEVTAPSVWSASYPDWLARQPFASALQRTFTIDPFPSPTTTTDQFAWRPSYPDRLRRLDLLTADHQSLAFPPQPELTSPSAWSAIFPDWLARLTVRPALQQAFTTAVQPEVTNPLAWSAVYPDRIDRRVLPTADHLCWVSSSQPELTNPSAWSTCYPDRIPRFLVRAADQPYFSTGSTASSLPVPPLGWAPRYPERISRTTLSTATIPTLALEPFPRPGAILLSAWAFYPDRIVRFVVHSARLPFHSYGTWEPIPNPPVVTSGEEKIHLGTKESLGVTNNPTLGGWQAW